MKILILAFLTTFALQSPDMQTYDFIQLFFFLLISGLSAILLFEIRQLNRNLVARKPYNEEGMKLTLQSLERLTLFVERSSLQGLLARTDLRDKSAPDLYQSLIETLQAEFAYNQSQRVYVSPEVWNAVERMKDQQVYIINQITAHLPPGATAGDLAKRLVEYSMTPNAELNATVLDAIQYEAKKKLN